MSLREKDIKCLYSFWTISKQTVSLLKKVDLLFEEWNKDWYYVNIAMAAWWLACVLQVDEGSEEQCVSFLGTSSLALIYIQILNPDIQNIPTGDVT